MSNHLNPYIEHGKKNELIKKMTVSVPIELYEIIQTERKRRIDNKMRHATASELLCEAFAHAFTGQPLPTDEELFRYVSKAKAEKYELLRKQTKDENINNAMTIADTYIGFIEFRTCIHKILQSGTTDSEITIQLYRFINLLTTYVISETMSTYALRKEAQLQYEAVEKINHFKSFLDFIDYNVNSTNRNVLIASEIKKILDHKPQDKH